MAPVSRAIFALLLAISVVACSSPAPTASPFAATQTTMSEWERVLDGAKREGSVQIIGPTGDDRRTALTEGFQKQYGINVEYLADAGVGIPPRLTAERGANQYLWDIFIGGTTTALESLIPMGALDPLEPALVRAETKDPSKWRGGGLEFVDEGHTDLVMTPFHRGTLFINTTMVQPDEIKSYRDLLDPKWRGKMATDDPRRPGPGQATFTFFYLHPDLGPDFIRALARQELTIMQDYQQEIDGVGQGRYPLLIGSSDALAEARMKQGIPLGIVDPTILREKSDISPASGSVGIFNQAPHPNAARVYLDWLLSKDGQTDFARATGYISARSDVPTDHTFAWRVPQPGAIKTYDQNAMDVRDPVLAIANETLGSR